jgi:hypothetical protein
LLTVLKKPKPNLSLGESISNFIINSNQGLKFQNRVKVENTLKIGVNVLPFYKSGFTQQLNLLNVTSDSKYFKIHDVASQVSSQKKIYSFFSLLNLKYEIVNNFKEEFSLTAKLTNTQIYTEQMLTNVKFFENPKSSYFTRKKFNITSNFFSTTNTKLDNFRKMARIRFKPGYSKQWRLFRNDFQQIFNFKLAYQNRLTLLFQKMHLKNQKISTFLKLTPLLLYAHFATDLCTAKNLVIKKITYVNGHLCTNQDFGLILNDCVQLIVSLKHFFILKWSLQNSLKTQQRTLKLLSKFRNKSYTSLPKWVLKTHNFFYSIPINLEVDYFTLSIFFFKTYNPKFSSNFLATANEAQKVKALYNWKYVI